MSHKLYNALTSWRGTSSASQVPPASPSRADLPQRSGSDPRIKYLSTKLDVLAEEPPYSIHSTSEAFSDPIPIPRRRQTNALNSPLSSSWSSIGSYDLLASSPTSYQSQITTRSVTPSRGVSYQQAKPIFTYGSSRPFRRRTASDTSIYSIRSLGWAVPPSFGSDSISSSLSTSSSTGAMDLTDQIVRVGARPMAIGGYSTIWLGEWQRSPNDTQDGCLKVVIKTLHALDLSEDTHTHERKSLKRLLREIRVWQQLDHPNIVPLCGYTWEDHITETSMMASLVSPYFQNGTVVAYLARNPRADRLQLCRHVANGLSYLHHLNPVIVHGDLKGANVLINDKGAALICDFGLSSLLDNRSTGFTSSVVGGTVRYLAPELLDESSRTTQSDIYALACVCTEILHNLVPYAQLRMDAPVLAAIFRKDRPATLVAATSESDVSFTSPSSLSPPEVVKLLNSCWNHITSERPSIDEIIECLTRVAQRYTTVTLGIIRTQSVQGNR